MKILKKETFPSFDLYEIEYRLWITTHKSIIIYINGGIYCWINEKLVPIADYFGATFSLTIINYIGDIEREKRLDYLAETIKNELRKFPSN